MRHCFNVFQRTVLQGTSTDINIYMQHHQSKKIRNDQELIQSDPISCPQIDSSLRKARVVNQMNSSLPDRWSDIQLPKLKYVTHIIGEPKYKYGQQEQVTVRNHNRGTALELSVLKYWGLKPVLQDPNLALRFCCACYALFCIDYLGNVIITNFHTLKFPVGSLGKMLMSCYIMGYCAK